MIMNAINIALLYLIMFYLILFYVWQKVMLMK
jgi:hypothetical protein